MPEAPLRHAAITAVGAYLPEDRLTNADLEKMVDTTDEWILSRTGIRERRILRDPAKATAYMATEAARQALDKRGLSPEDIDVIIVGTVTADMSFPATANLVQDALGASRAWGFDVSAACCGFLFSLTTGARLVESGAYDRVLVIGADTMSRIIDYTDRTTCVLFGDAAGAVILEADDEWARAPRRRELLRRLRRRLAADARGRQPPPALARDDRRGDAQPLPGRPRRLQARGHRHGRRLGRDHGAQRALADDVRYLVPHQANLRIIDATARRMGLATDKVMLNIERYGNTTAATIPLCLWDWESELRRGDNLVLAAFGGGFTWGATYLKWAYDGTPEA